MKEVIPPRKGFFYLIMSQFRPTKIFHGWFIVATIFFVVMVTSGIRSGMGVFVLPMSEEFGWSRGVISLAGALGILILSLIHI